MAGISGCNTLHIPLGVMKNLMDRHPFSASLTFELARKTDSFFILFSRTGLTDILNIKITRNAKRQHQSLRRTAKVSKEPQSDSSCLSKQGNHVLPNEPWSLLKQLAIKNFLFSSKVKAPWSKSTSLEDTVI